MPAAPTDARPYDALVVDWGGVLTSPLADMMSAFIAGEGIEPDSFVTAMGALLGPSGAGEAAVSPVHALERGELEVPHFEEQLAVHLVSTTGGPVRPAGLLERMFAGLAEHEGMVDVVRRAKSHGLSTALLSNSWGNEYPLEAWGDLFDVLVISGEVGLRKPEPEIYALTAERLALPPHRCVFVDDLAPNVHGAAAVGMVGVHHESYDATVAELELLLEVPLRPHG